MKRNFFLVLALFSGVSFGQFDVNSNPIPAFEVAKLDRADFKEVFNTELDFSQNVDFFVSYSIPYIEVVEDLNQQHREFIESFAKINREDTCSDKSIKLDYVIKAKKVLDLQFQAITSFVQRHELSYLQISNRGSVDFIFNDKSASLALRMASLAPVLGTKVIQVNEKKDQLLRTFETEIAEFQVYLKGLKDGQASGPTAMLILSENYQKYARTMQTLVSDFLKLSDPSSEVVAIFEELQDISEQLSHLYSNRSLYFGSLAKLLNLSYNRLTIASSGSSINQSQFYNNFSAYVLNYQQCN